MYIERGAGAMARPCAYACCRLWVGFGTSSMRGGDAICEHINRTITRHMRMHIA
jgi:hypothetical protein